MNNVVSHKTVKTDVRKSVFSKATPCQKDKVHGLTKCNNGVERSPASRIASIFKEIRRVAPRLRGCVDSASVWRTGFKEYVG